VKGKNVLRRGGWLSLGLPNSSGASMQRSGTIVRLIGRSGNMSQEDIKKLSSYDFNLEEQKSMEISTSECVVCLEKFKS
jgi:hypothetical protein